MGATVNRGEIIHARRGVCWRARYARVLVVAHADGESGWLSVYLSCNFLCKTLAGPVRFASPLALDTRYHTRPRRYSRIRHMQVLSQRAERVFFLGAPRPYSSSSTLTSTSSWTIGSFTAPSNLFQTPSTMR